MTHQLHRTQQLRCDIDTVWNFFSSLLNLSHLTPKSMRFRVLTNLTDDSIYEGVLIGYKVSPFMGNFNEIDNYYNAGG